MASLQAYAATGDRHGLQIHLYAAGTLTAGEHTVSVATGYPWDGRIDVTVESAGDRTWTLALRVPGWCSEARLTVNGAPARIGAQAGYLRISRVWRAGDRVSLMLAMPPRRITPDPRVDAVRATVALARGPVVYCLEHADLPSGVYFEDVVLAAGSPTEQEHALAPVALRVPVRVRGDAAAFAVPAVPYYLWANRAPGPMRVWIPVE
jgi:DUF1680 family protein